MSDIIALEFCREDSCPEIGKELTSSFYGNLIIKKKIESK